MPSHPTVAPYSLRRRWRVTDARAALAALDAGVSAGAIAKACGVAWSQATRWRLVEHAGRVTAAAPEAQVLSVVDSGAPAPASSSEGVELCVGPWRISVSRKAD